MLSVLAFLLQLLPAQANSDWAVNSSQFQQGSFWVWQYSELSENQWNPYLYERYSVTQVQGTKLTIEMSSSAQASAVTEAHHKFIVDFKSCEAAAIDSKKAHFKVEFYTKSLSPSWTLVSKNHTNLVFTEKFNCMTSAQTPAQLDSFDFQGQNQPIFQWPSTSHQEVSWYFANHARLKGVASGKVFLPTRKYKMELVEFY